MVFSYKLGCLPENVLQTLLNDRLVAKGSVLGFVTTFFQVGHQLCFPEVALGHQHLALGPPVASEPFDLPGCTCHSCHTFT